MISVQTNVASLSAQRNLNRTQGNLMSNIAKLSSGFRINRAADDAAGLAISEEMKADIRSLSQAKRNAADATSLFQTYEGGLEDITGMLERMRELATQASTGTLTGTQRDYIQVEVSALVSEINAITQQTDFNALNLLSGTMSVTFQIGLDSSDILSVSFSTGMAASAIGVSGLQVSTQALAVGALATIDTALGNVSTRRAQVGAFENRLDVISNNISIRHENLSAANSRIRDTDIASEMASLTRNQILSQAGAAMLAQANASPQVALSLLG